MSLIGELKRRNVFRVAAAYGVVSWLLLQVSDVLVNALDLPTAWSKTLIALLVIGLVPVLVFSWVYEMTPEGLKRESEVTPDASVTAHTARKLDLAVIVLLLLAIGLFVADRVWLREPAAVVAVTAPAAESAAPDNAEPAVPVVAVLPLNALSDDQEGTFLASGLHDDLITKLAKLQAFRVISRTSVMEYAGATQNVREIGQALGARYIVEGGLQSIGGRVSINAQLIDANTDQHLWAETYNRELTTANLFDVQADIASAIAEELHAALSPSDIETLEAVPTQNLAAYRAYLRGLDLDDTLTQQAFYEGARAFQEATDLDPEFAQAWSKLSTMLIRRYWEEGGEDAMAPDPELRAKAEAAQARAEALNPDSVETLVSGAYIRYYGYRDFAGALILLGQAAASAPHNPEVVSLRGYLLRRLGRLDEAADAIVQALELDHSLGDAVNAMNTLRLVNRCPEAVDISNRTAPGSEDENILLETMMIRAMCQDDLEGAVTLSDRIHVSTLENWGGLVPFLEAAREYDRAITASLAALDTLSRSEDRSAQYFIQGELAWLYRLAGQPARAAEALARAVAASEGLPRNSAILQQDALMAALRGETADAVALTRRALATFPDDLWSRPWVDYDAARTLAIAGAREEALVQVEHMTATARFEERYRLARDPAFDALREEPRFQAALEP